MAIKGGELVHVGNTVLIDRLQTAGPGSLSIPTEKVYELGNYETIGVTRDIPDLSFPMESLDASAEMEAMLLGRDFATDSAGQEYDLALCRVIDVLSQFKAGQKSATPFNVVASAVVPYLTLESISYRFGVRDNATQSASFRGDGIFYAAASAFVQTTAGTNAANQTIQLANNPIPYNGDTVNGTRYALSVSIAETGRRLSVGTDYTEALNVPAAGNVTVTIKQAVPTSQTIRIVYQSVAATASYPQVSHAAASATRPAAIRGKDIEIRVGGNTVTDRWSSVQSVNVDWQVQLERDEELGNSQVVSQDYEVPEVRGSVELRPFDPAEMIARIKQIAGVSGNEVVGPLQVTQLPIDIILHSPVDGTVLKTLHIPDAEFTIPGFSGQVQSKMNLTLDFESVSGSLSVFKGARP